MAVHGIAVLAVWRRSLDKRPTYEHRANLWGDSMKSQRRPINLVAVLLFIPWLLGMVASAQSLRIMPTSA